MVLVLWTGVFCVNTNVAAHEGKLSLVSPAEVKIRIDSMGPGHSWSFQNAHAGVLGLAERVEQFRAFDERGNDVGAKKIATGEFRSNGIADAIKTHPRSEEHTSE